MSHNALCHNTKMIGRERKYLGRSSMGNKITKKYCSTYDGNTIHTREALFFHSSLFHVHRNQTSCCTAITFLLYQTTLDILIFRASSLSFLEYHLWIKQILWFCYLLLTTLSLTCSPHSPCYLCRSRPCSCPCYPPCTSACHACTPRTWSPCGPEAIPWWPSSALPWSSRMCLVAHLSRWGCDFFRKYTDTQIHIRTRRNFFSDVDHCFQMVSNDYFLFFCDFVGTQIHRYADRFPPSCHWCMPLHYNRLSVK